MNVCHAQILVTKSQGQGHNLHSKYVSYVIALGFVSHPHLLQKRTEHIFIDIKLRPLTGSVRAIGTKTKHIHDIHKIHE